RAAAPAHQQAPAARLARAGDGVEDRAAAPVEEAPAGLQDGQPPHGRGARAGAHRGSPSSSGRPVIKLRFCTACPEAPFTRLSIAEKTTACLVPGTEAQPMAQAFVSLTSAVEGRPPSPSSRTKGAPT